VAKIVHPEPIEMIGDHPHGREILSSCLGDLLRCHHVQVTTIFGQAGARMSFRRSGFSVFALHEMIG